MAHGNGNPGMNLLAQALNSQMQRYHEDIKHDLKIDFGKIGNDWALTTNSFPHPIPKGDYTVCRCLTGISLQTEISSGHMHELDLPKLKKGDHVLVVWTKNDVCVIDVIMSSSVL